MAPMSGPGLADQSSLPLADYFFIAGIESTAIWDEKLAQNALQSSPPMEDTIEEHTVLDTSANGRPKSNEGLGLSGLEGRRKSNGTARFSYETRKSIGSLIGGPSSGSASNRSSATIRPVQESTNGVQLTDQGGPVNAPSGMSDEDFESALKKFASERDEFMEDLHFSAGTLPTIPKAKPRPRTQKIISDEASGLRGGVGSIRRRLSTMNSLKRQPSVMRQCESWMCHHAKVKLTHNSIDSHFEASQRLQLGHSESTTFPRRSKHASIEEEVRASTTGQVSTKEHGRRAKATQPVPRLRTYVRISQRHHRTVLRRKTKVNVARLLHDQRRRHQIVRHHIDHVAPAQSDSIRRAGTAMRRMAESKHDG